MDLLQVFSKKTLVSLTLKGASSPVRWRKPGVPIWRRVWGSFPGELVVQIGENDG